MNATAALSEYAVLLPIICCGVAYTLFHCTLIAGADYRAIARTFQDHAGGSDDGVRWATLLGVSGHLATFRDGVREVAAEARARGR